MPEAYRKLALSFEQQLDQLIDRGLVVKDKPAALRALSVIGYYRLSAYWHPFRLRDAQGNVSSQLIPETDFDEILRLYEFDRRLRLLIMDAIERAEVAVRTRLTYHLAHKFGPFAHTSEKNFHPKFDHSNFMLRLSEESRRSSDQFIKHYRQKYEGFPTLPIWMTTEIISLGTLSRLYRGLRNEDKKAVASCFDVHHKRLSGWLHVMTYVRNVCAHHSRLWNRVMAIRADASKDPNWLPPNTPRNDRIFYVLLILSHLIRETGNGAEWRQQVSSLLSELDDTEEYRLAMGLPENWRKHPIWK